VFSLPYTHYSLIARSEALHRYFVDGCCWEEAVPPLKDPDRVPDSSTLRRWFRELDSSHPPFTFLRRAIRNRGSLDSLTSGVSARRIANVLARRLYVSTSLLAAARLIISDAHHPCLAFVTAVLYA
jgi:hypothetical protein